MTELNLKILVATSDFESRTHHIGQKSKVVSREPLFSGQDLSDLVDGQVVDGSVSCCRQVEVVGVLEGFLIRLVL